MPYIQWPFPEPKLKVLTIYKAYVFGLCKKCIPTTYSQIYGTNVPPFKDSEISIDTSGQIITTSLFSLTGNYWLITEIIPKWPSFRLVNYIIIMIYPDILTIY